VFGHTKNVAYGVSFSRYRCCTGRSNARTNKIGATAEKIGHHPDVYLAWGKARVTISTHKVHGLTESDFILAAKIEKL